MQTTLPSLELTFTKSASFPLPLSHHDKKKPPDAHYPIRRSSTHQPYYLSEKRQRFYPLRRVSDSFLRRAQHHPSFDSSYRASPSPRLFLRTLAFTRSRTSSPPQRLLRDRRLPDFLSRQVSNPFRKHTSPPSHHPSYYPFHSLHSLFPYHNSSQTTPLPPLPSTPIHLELLYLSPLPPYRSCSSKRLHYTLIPLQFVTRSLIPFTSHENRILNFPVTKP